MMQTNSDWLLGIKKESANYNPKSPDSSLNYLIDLLNDGYDRVTWVGSDRDKEANEICKKYDDAETTWTLESFLNIHSGFLSMNIKKESRTRDEYSDAEWERVISNPSYSLKFARENNFLNLPVDIIDSIASDLDVSQRFVNQFLSKNQTDPIPQPIVDTTLSDPEAMAYIVDVYGEQPNIPADYHQMTQGMGDKTKVVNKHTFSSGDANIPFNAPIFSHSHVGCQCFLAVWKSTNPEDVVFVDANGRF